MDRSFFVTDRPTLRAQMERDSFSGVGTNTTLRILPPLDAVLVVLCNCSPPMADRMADCILGGPSDS